MSLNQLNFAGLNRIEVAIARLKEFEPPEGYYLAFSGGKDSIVIYDLAVKSGVKFDAHYAQGGIDPPELVRFIQKNYPDVQFHRPEMSVWKMILKRGLPRRQSHKASFLFFPANAGNNLWPHPDSYKTGNAGLYARPIFLTNLGTPNGH